MHLPCTCHALAMHVLCTPCPALTVTESARALSLEAACARAGVSSHAAVPVSRQARDRQRTGQQVKRDEAERHFQQTMQLLERTEATLVADVGEMLELRRRE